jgi:hypothetical protein
MAEVMPEPVRVHRDAALLAAARDDLVDTSRGQRAAVADPQP